MSKQSFAAFQGHSWIAKTLARFKSKKIDFHIYDMEMEFLLVWFCFLLHALKFLTNISLERKTHIGGCKGQGWGGGGQRKRESKHLVIWELTDAVNKS